MKPTLSLDGEKVEDAYSFTIYYKNGDDFIVRQWAEFSACEIVQVETNDLGVTVRRYKNGKMDKSVFVPYSNISEVVTELQEVSQ